MMKTIIITGGHGFIGKNLIKYLNSYYNIVNIDNSLLKSPFKAKIKNKKTVNINCSIGNKKIIAKILKKYKPKLIFNLAAETHVDRSIDNPENFIQNNIIGVYNLLEYFREYTNKFNSKLIHISTDEVYGDVLKGRTSEKYPYKPSSPYAASKAASDHLVYSYVRTFNLKAIITNCSNNYGPKQHPEKLIPKIIYNIIKNKPIPIYGKGLNSREWIYVRDHCDALYKIFLKGKIGNFYNIGSNKNLTNLEVCRNLIDYSKKIIKLQNKVKIEFVQDRPGHDIRYALNSNKIKKELNWKPKTTFKQGLKLTFDWYNKNRNYYKTLSKKDIIKRLGIK